MKTVATMVVLEILLASADCRAGDPLPEQLKVCVSMRNDSERLACYDHAVASIQSGGSAAPPPSAENMFGATQAVKQPKHGDPEPAREDLQEISGRVTAMHVVTEDKLIVLTLDNGQVWRQQDLDSHLTIDIDDSVTIVRASLGTFRITDKRGHSARFKRVR
jgi:hypothetical protein